MASKIFTTIHPSGNMSVVRRNFDSEEQARHDKLGLRVLGKISESIQSTEEVKNVTVQTYSSGIVEIHVFEFDTEG